jgi:hypothetical protein
MPECWNYNRQAGWARPPMDTYRGAFLADFLDAVAQYPQVAAGYRAGRFVAFDRAVQVTVPAGGTVARAISVSGGSNALVFNRTFSVARVEPPLAAVPPAMLHNVDTCYVSVQLARKYAPGDDEDGIDIEQAPGTSIGASGWSDFTGKMPEFWSGRDVHELSISNSGLRAVRVTLAWQLAII